MSITIRAYNKKDKNNCMAAFKSNVPTYFAVEEMKDFENFLDSIEFLDTINNNNKLYFFVIDYKQSVIGCGGFGDKDNAKIISLAWGLVHNDFHKKGYGKKLLLYRLEQIKLLYPKFPVVIDTSQYSYTFFEKYGFQTTKITKDYYSIGLHRYDMTLKAPSDIY
jgi:predicted GNAT family N-acyltransferase